jgi:chorismate dehydratase
MRLLISMKIGQSHFKNTDFIYYPINRGWVSADGVEYVRAHPPALGRMLEVGEVDVAPTSSIIYAKNFNDFYILPDFSVSAYGRTGSILLFSEMSSLQDLERSTVAVPGTSASSSALMEIILKMKGIDADILYHEEPNLDAMLKKADAALLIGDDALKANYASRQVLCDLGGEWKELTGQKMAYALWVIRKEAANKNPKEISRFYNNLVLSKRKATEEIDTISAKLAGDIGVAPGFMKAHLETLDYGLGSDVIKGLEEYFGRAYEFGILDRKPSLNFFEVQDAR